ncbi:unnamed protein product [Cyclocybe aegerita]|uniref:C2H2-type domain-containing protein n=1 Tax=Cyclocybe aegerita TaxID=1973307 RepID=A0A8S0XYK8_CYCAE|nr:unnamed protein product [Cyclocybe aegerita]
MAVSLPSIHEMFPAHLIHRDGLNGEKMTGQSPPEQSYPHRSDVSGRRRQAVASTQSSTQVYPLHTNTVAAHAQTPAPRPSLAAHASTHTRLSLGSQQHPCSQPRPPTQSPDSPDLPCRQPHQRTADASDSEEDASEGEPDPSYVSTKKRPTYSAYRGAPPFQAPTHGMSRMPMNFHNVVPSEKKHACPTCFKRFNRPSSLRIHVNTHTGATPFRCPWPNCGREFNVNSNMKRHYRNHTTAAASSGALSSSSGYLSSYPHPSDSNPIRTRVFSPITTSTHLATPPALRGYSPPCDGCMHGFPAVESHARDAPDDRWRKSQRPERGARHMHIPNQLQPDYITHQMEREKERATRPPAGDEEEVDELGVSDGEDMGAVDGPHVPSPSSGPTRPRGVEHLTFSSPSPSLSPLPPLAAFGGSSSRSSHSSASSSVPESEATSYYNLSMPYSSSVTNPRVSTGVLRPAFMQTMAGGR